MLLEPREKVIVLLKYAGSAISMVVHDLALDVTRQYKLGKATGGRLHPGNDGYFSLELDGRRMHVTVRNFDAPDDVLCACSVSCFNRKLVGPTSPWSHVPKHYVRWVDLTFGPPYSLITINPDMGVSSKPIMWFDSKYDFPYVFITNVTAVPNSPLVLMTLQRSAYLYIHDTSSNCLNGRIQLKGSAGSHRPLWSREGDILIAASYDTLNLIDRKDWRITHQHPFNTAIGEPSLSSDGSLLLVPCPYLGEVHVLDLKTLEPRGRAITEGKPVSAVLLRDGRLYFQDRENPWRIMSAVLK